MRGCRAAAVLNLQDLSIAPAEFTQGIDSLVNDWLGTESGESWSNGPQWAGAHPYIVAGVAVMAAAAAILADMDARAQGGSWIGFD